MADNSGTPISPVTDSRPDLRISAPSPIAINNEPVELEGTPASPVKTRDDRRGSKGDTTEISPEEQEKRAKLMSERKEDPAVLVDIPQTPGAEEFGRSEDAEASVSSNTRGSATS